MKPSEARIAHNENQDGKKTEAGFEACHSNTSKQEVKVDSHEPAKVEDHQRAKTLESSEASEASESDSYIWSPSAMLRPTNPHYPGYGLGGVPGPFNQVYYDPDRIRRLQASSPSAAAKLTNKPFPSPACAPQIGAGLAASKDKDVIRPSPYTPHPSNHPPQKRPNVASTAASRSLSGIKPPLKTKDPSAISQLSGKSKSTPCNLGRIETAVEPDASVEITHIIPRNMEAKRAFDELVQTRAQLDTHHSQFIVIHKEKTALHGRGREAPEEEEDSRESPERDNTDLLYHGYFRLSSDCQPLLPSLRYSMGSGVDKVQHHRNVDILLARHKTARSKYLGRAHAFLTLHPGSGAWLLQAGFGRHDLGNGETKYMDFPDGLEDCHHETVIFDGQAMKHGAFRCLCKPRTTFVAADMEFLIEFKIDTWEQEEKYRQKLKSWLTGSGASNSDSKQSGIPFESDIITKWAVFRQGIGSGTFGVVYEGFHPLTGDPRAIKKVQIKKLSQKEDAQLEVELGTKLGDVPGLVKMFGWCNHHGQSRWLDVYPYEIFIFQEKGLSFLQYDWAAETWVDKVRLCRQLLKGLSHIHSFDWMHRDITPANTLIFKKPLRAAICDYGKLCKTPTSNQWAIAPEVFLPPEVKPFSYRTYDQKIDIWLLGLTLLHSWFPRQLWGAQKKIRTQEEHAQVLLNLGNFAWEDDSSGIELWELASLMGEMLSWKAQDRPTADQTLEFPGMDDDDSSPSLKRSAPR